MGILIVGFSDEQRLLSGSQSWTGKSFEDIKNIFDLSQLNKDLIVEAYGYYSKAVDKHKPVKVLKITNIFVKDDSITMYYSVGDELIITSESFKSKTQKILRTDKVVEQNNYLPFCSILNNFQSERYPPHQARISS